jgi:hypothetical protein
VVVSSNRSGVMEVHEGPPNLLEICDAVSKELRSESMQYTPDAIRHLFKDFQLYESELCSTESKLFDDQGPFPKSQQMDLSKDILIKYFVDTLRLNVERVYGREINSLFTHERGEQDHDEDYIELVSDGDEEKWITVVLSP